MADTVQNNTEVPSSSPKTATTEHPAGDANPSGNVSQTLFPESPVYEPEEDLEINPDKSDEDTPNATNDETEQAKPKEEEQTPSLAKRKLSDEPTDTNAKIQKLDLTDDNSAPTTQTLDDEVSAINNVGKRKLDDPLPSVSRVRTPIRSSPRKLAKRCNSADLDKPKTPKTPKTRPASADITKSRKTPRKIQLDKFKENVEPAASTFNSRPSVEFVAEIPPPKTVPETIEEEENSELNDSQNFHLVMSPSPEDDVAEKPKIPEYSSDPVEVKDRKEILDPGKIHETHSEGFTYSDQNSNLSQPRPKDLDKKATDQDSTDSISSLNLESLDHVQNVASKKISKLSKGNPGKIHETRSEEFTYSDQNSNLSQPRPKDFDKKATDQESTDSIGSLNLESPDHVPNVASKIISKLSNGNSSTPSDLQGKHAPDSTDSTPDMIKINGNKLKRAKNESFKNSNSSTPSTISPLQNGHSLPASTPQIPIFDIHVSHNEDCEFLSLYVARIDNDVSMDMYKEYQRISKRFTMDGYQADVSSSNSTSSVTSAGMLSLPNRVSFSSTMSSLSTSSSRTSDGNFLVPQAPRKSVINPSTSVKGYDALFKKLQEIFSHVREASGNDSNRSLIDDKVSVAVQTSLSNDSSMSNGNASPEEVGKCDKATPKSSLKKSRVRGRRHIAGKTKRALLPTQIEEPEMMHGMNSPEMVPTNGENGKESPIKSPKEEKPLSTLVATPKSVSKLKQKRRPTSPRLVAAPVEKTPVKQEYPGYPPDTVVLAKWAADKRYYAGKVMQITEPNKYLIKFDDGPTKVLLDDFIIFGDMKTLPLQGQSVYALVDEQLNYEPGLVLGVEENDSGTVTYKCTTDGDMLVMVTASELYLTEDQARSLKESARARSPMSPSTPRRRHNRELDLDNIIQGPRSARNRDKGNSSAKKRVASPKSPKASTSGVKSQAKSTPVGRKRLASESSEISESSNSAPPVRLEEVAGVEPEVQRTPRKIDGVKAGPLQLKGAAKQNIGKKNSKLTKFENDEDTVTQMGPIPPSDSKLFAGLCFLLTCTDTPRREREKSQSHYSSEEDGETGASMAANQEDIVFCPRPFNKERLKEQIEAGGGTVYSHFDDVPKNKHSVCKLIAPRPCLTAKYIQCLAADVRALTHGWVIASCTDAALADYSDHVLPAGWSLQKNQFIDWVPASGKRNTQFFKDKLILLCSDQDTFLKFWDRVCTLAGANTRVVNEDDLNMSGAIALVTEWDCPHEVQNKANQDNIPLVSTHWVIQCLIEGKVLDPNGHAKFSFAFTEQE